MTSGVSHRWYATTLRQRGYPDAVEARITATLVRTGTAIAVYVVHVETTTEALGAIPTPKLKLVEWSDRRPREELRDWLGGEDRDRKSSILGNCLIVDTSSSKIPSGSGAASHRRAFTTRRRSVSAPTCEGRFDLASSPIAAPLIMKPKGANAPEDLHDHDHDHRRWPSIARRGK
ncbi:hypothetical protein [Actinopolymorpha alba]|uniref:hypothetical protein n=1 Tax=Actinopolymorpha alba TaxID=533267 RepID=UPI0012F67407|nr:hypothetical protein [Actinopolymorpha alba]